MNLVVPTLSWCFVLGLATGLHLDVAVHWLEVMAISGSLALALALLRGAHPRIWVMLFGLLGLGLGALHAERTVRAEVQRVDGVDLAELQEDRLILADVLESPRAGVERCRVRLQLVAFERSDQWVELGVPVTGVSNACPRLARGDRIVVMASVWLVSPSRAPEWRQIRARGVFGQATLLEAPLIVASSPDGWTIVDQARSRAEERIRQGTDTEVSGVLLAMLTGSRGELSADRRWQFAATGTAHVLAVSGLHLSLLVLGTYGVMRRAIRIFTPLVRRWPADRWAAILVVPLIVAYVVFTGAPSSARRAGAMAAVAMVGTLLGRSSQGWHALSLAAAAVACDDPWQVTGVGFQLSVTATAGLVLHARLTAPARGFFGQTWAGIRASIVATLATAPVLAWHFGEIPVLGPIANLLMVPPLTLVALPCGALGALVPAGAGVDTVLLQIAEYAVRLTYLLADASDGVLTKRWVCGRPLGASWWIWCTVSLSSPWFGTRKTKQWFVTMVIGSVAIVGWESLDQPDVRVEQIALHGGSWVVLSSDGAPVIVTDGRGNAATVDRRVGRALRMEGGGCATVVLLGVGGRGLDGLWDRTCIEQLVVTGAAYDGRWSLRAIRQAQAREIPVRLLTSRGVSASSGTVSCIGEACESVEWRGGDLEIGLWLRSVDVRVDFGVIAPGMSWDARERTSIAARPWRDADTRQSWAVEIRHAMDCWATIVEVQAWNP